LRIAPVSETDVWAADVEFAGLAVGDFVAGVVEEHAFAIWVELADAAGAVEGQKIHKYSYLVNLLIN
jgi:hypothetical protein